MAPDPLYPTEAQLAARIVGPGLLKKWTDLAALLEREGLPPIDPVMGGRYWPAVQVFFDRRHGVGGSTAPPALDGIETW